MTMYIGIDIGGTSIKCGLVDGNGHISRKVTRTTATTKSDIMADLVAMVQELQTGLASVCLVLFKAMAF